jgi:hypothetical protein
MVVVECFRMERGEEVVVKWVPSWCGMAAMKSLFEESDLSVKMLVTLLVSIGVGVVSVDGRVAVVWSKWNSCHERGRWEYISLSTWRPTSANTTWVALWDGCLGLRNPSRRHQQA